MTSTVQTITYTAETEPGTDGWRDLCEQAYSAAREVTDQPEDITTIEPYGDGRWLLGVTLRDGSHGLVWLVPTTTPEA